jgi:DtxR family Mn-dependent transcriptional regulator
MVARLRAEDYLEVDGRRTLTLTEKGRDWSVTIVRRHRLAERFLTDLLGLPWHRTHVEASRWEHLISGEVEELIRDKLGNPATCPHGNPIPGAQTPDIEVVRLS